MLKMSYRANPQPSGALEERIRLSCMGSSPWALYSAAAGSPVTWERQGCLTGLQSLACSSRFSFAPELGKQQNATAFLLLHSSQLETLYSLMAC